MNSTKGREVTIWNLKFVDFSARCPYLYQNIKTMKKNVGTIDTIIRVVLAFVIGILYLTDIITGVLALVLGLVAVIFLVTGLVGWCPLWYMFGITTAKQKAAEPPKP
jgi:hypothetical protein